MLCSVAFQNHYTISQHTRLKPNKNEHPPTQLSLDKAIVMVLGRNRGITKEEIFNYIKYQSLMGDTQPTQHDVNQECDKLIRSSKIEKKNDEQQIHLFSY